MGRVRLGGVTGCALARRGPDRDGVDRGRVGQTGALAPLPAARCLLLLCALSFDTPGGVVDGEVAEFVSFGARQGSSREGVASGTLWVDGAHSELIAACLLGSEFTGQQFRRASVTATQMLLVTTALPWLRSSSMVICRHLVSR